MKRFLISFLFGILVLQTASAQTRTDSISGNYTRHTWIGVGNMHMDYGNGTFAEVTGYTISTTDETLVLDKNHCAALTVFTQQGNGGLGVFLWGNPIVYYGIWRMSGDTMVITYTKSYAEQPFIIYGDVQPPGITKMAEPMQRHYFMEDYGVLTSLTPGDNENYLFYKEEEHVQ